MALRKGKNHPISKYPQESSSQLSECGSAVEASQTWRFWKWLGRFMGKEQLTWERLVWGWEGVLKKICCVHVLFLHLSQVTSSRCLTFGLTCCCHSSVLEAAWSALLSFPSANLRYVQVQAIMMEPRGINKGLIRYHACSLRLGSAWITNGDTWLAYFCHYCAWCDMLKPASEAWKILSCFFLREGPWGKRQESITFISYIFGSSALRVLANWSINGVTMWF